MKKARGRAGWIVLRRICTELYGISRYGITAGRQ